MKTLIARQRRAVLNQRRRHLLDTIRQQGGVWRTSTVVDLYRDNAWGCCRPTARNDLAYLARHGLLDGHGPDNDRRYTPGRPA